MANSAETTTRWARIFVAELAAGGLNDVCVAPGSRSTPLTMAFAEHAGVKLHMHLDERSASFFALGLALVTKRAVALLCTSGSAGANFHPAIVEAYQSAVPLLVLTADRPPELRHSGANQTIDQVKMFADHVLWAADMALPEVDAAAVAERNIRTMAMRALAIANGIRPGPVHLNVPFRKPLEPAGRQLTPLQAVWTQRQQGRLLPDPEQIESLAALINKEEQGIIVCGPTTPGDDFPAALAELARRSGYPIFADPLSGLRFGATDPAGLPLITSYESLFRGGRQPGWSEPTVILRFGAVPISKWLNNYLETVQTVERYHFRANGIWADDTHLTRHFWQVDEALLCAGLNARVVARETEWTAQLLAAEAEMWARLDAKLATEWFDGSAVAEAVRAIPAGTHLVMGNSLPIRHLDQFGQLRPGPLHIYGNRGASGIDGNVSTALGVAAATEEPTVLIIGDITFYHDMNGLYALRQLQTPLVIVLLNNDGGGIFRRLPIASHEAEFTPHFLTPHGLDFSHVASLYGLEFVRVTGRSDFQAALARAFAHNGHSLIEIQTDGDRDEAIRRQIIATL